MCNFIIKTFHLQHVSVFHVLSVSIKKYNVIPKIMPVHCSNSWNTEQSTEV